MQENMDNDMDSTRQGLGLSPITENQIAQKTENHIESGIFPWFPGVRAPKNISLTVSWAQGLGC